MKRVTVKTTAKVYTVGACDPSPTREYKHYGYINQDGVFYYDGNWEAMDNDLYNYYPDENETKETQTLMPSEYEIIMANG
jgi:hypothetical protein